MHVPLVFPPYCPLLDLLTKELGLSFFPHLPRLNLSLSPHPLPPHITPREHTMAVSMVQRCKKLRPASIRMRLASSHQYTSQAPANWQETLVYIGRVK